MERPRRPRVEAIVLYHASVARLKKIQGMFGIIRHNSGPGGICKLIFAVLESQNTVFFTPYHWFSPILSSQNHHTTPYIWDQRCHHASTVWGASKKAFLRRYGYR